MTTAGPEKLMNLGSWLCDVPLPQQRRGRDHEDCEVGDEREDRLLRAHRRRRRVSECGRCERVQQSGRVLAVEPVGDPLVRAAVEAGDEPDQDDLQHGDVDQAHAERRRRLPEQDSERHAERAVYRQHEPHRADALDDVDCRRPYDGLALCRGDDSAEPGPHRKDDHGHDRHPGLKDDHATGQRREPSGPLAEDGLQSSPRVLGAGDQRAQHKSHRGSEREAGPHDVVDELVGVQGQDRHGVPDTAGMGRLVPLGRVEKHVDARDESCRHEEGRAKSILAPLSFDACDHDPCFSPVSWKKASSSDLSIGLNSLTPMPAAMSRLLISSVPEGSVLSLIEPFCRLTAAAPNIPVRSSKARSIGCAVTSTPSSPSRSCTVHWVTSLPPRITPTRSQICSTSGSRWLESSTVRLPWPMSLMSLRISAMPCGSSPLVGSSRMSSSGSFSSAAATPSRCFMPVEQVPNLRPARAMSSTMSSTSSTRLWVMLAKSATTLRFWRPERYG